MYHHSSVPCTGIRLHHWSVLSKRTLGSSGKILNSFQRHVKKVALILQYCIHFKKLTWYNVFSLNFFSLLKINEPMSFTVYFYNPLGETAFQCRQVLNSWRFSLNSCFQSKVCVCSKGQEGWGHHETLSPSYTSSCFCSEWCT